ncbi:GNAT family N-acetyltransferase [Nocardioides aequoreus]|uniref:GNAT family N-acetyltransferase n=1 Tax=Nocardioides aequoreus TaxID=397278 RepID=UPI0004C3EAFF|nr:GNAT family N-acetyltransferase [Nocardioides aequoreus]
MELTWSDVAAADLDAASLYDALVLRAAVFVVEQECAYADPDGTDLGPGVRHLLGRDDEGALAAYARVLPPDASYDAPRIGRVVVAPAARGAGLARRLMTEALAICEREWPGRAVELGGQAHLVGFYAGLGFESVGEGYVEDGIPHQWMRREVRSES